LLKNRIAAMFLVQPLWILALKKQKANLGFDISLINNGASSGTVKFNLIIIPYAENSFL